MARAGCTMQVRGGAVALAWLCALPSCAPGEVDGLVDGADAAAAGSATPEAPVVIDAPAGARSCAPGAYYLGRVAGQVLDYAGAPVARGLLSICGGACFPGETGADGRFSIAIDTCFPATAEYPHGAAFVFDGLNRRPDVFYDFNPGNATRMGLVTLTRPIYVATFEGGGRAVAPMRASAPLTVVDGLGFSLRFNPATIEYPVTAAEEAVRVVRVSVAKLPPYAVRAPAVAYAISPSDAVLSAPAAVEFPNVSGLAPGALVEIVAVGNHASGGRPALGVLARVDTGRVSADGRRVVASTGLRFFGTVGYRTVTP